MPNEDHIEIKSLFIKRTKLWVGTKSETIKYTGLVAIDVEGNKHTLDLTADGHGSNYVNLNWR